MYEIVSDSVVLTDGNRNITFYALTRCVNISSMNHLKLLYKAYQRKHPENTFTLKGWVWNLQLLRMFIKESVFSKINENN